MIVIIEKIPMLIVAVMIFAMFSYSDLKAESKNSRWYNQDMVTKGKPLYEKECASCHGLKGEGVAEKWNVKMSNGKYPPPPLNQEAHAWHHPMKALRFKIMYGGKVTGGVMPSYKEKLNEKQIDNIIAYFQNFWNNTYYKEWLKRGGLTK